MKFESGPYYRGRPLETCEGTAHDYHPLIWFETRSCPFCSAITTHERELGALCEVRDEALERSAELEVDLNILRERAE